MSPRAFVSQPVNSSTGRDEAQYEQKVGQEVRHQLVLLPFYSVFDNLEFSVKDDTVTLMGQVVRPALRPDAEAAVKHLEGAAQVMNEVTGLIAWVVYRKVGLALLPKAWLNFELVWATALVATGLATLLI